jgi:hypothetical protein
MINAGDFNLETAVGSQKSAQALGAPGTIKKYLITTKVTTTFFISPCTPISYTAFLRPTTVSRFNQGGYFPHIGNGEFFEGDEVREGPGKIDTVLSG